MSKFDKKKLCKLVGDDILRKHWDEYVELVKKPRYICARCGRAAHRKSHLCKPEKI